MECKNTLIVSSDLKCKPHLNGEKYYGDLQSCDQPTINSLS